jgi:hypothetical protein
MTPMMVRRVPDDSVGGEQYLEVGCVTVNAHFGVSEQQVDYLFVVTVKIGPGVEHRAVPVAKGINDDGREPLWHLAEAERGPIVGHLKRSVVGHRGILWEEEVA